MTNIRFKRLTFEGSSVARKATSFYVHQLKCLLDAGCEDERDIDTIFISHSHYDHTKALGQICLTNSRKITIVIPEESFEAISTYLSSVLTMNSGRKRSWKSKANFICMKPGLEIKFKSCGSSFVVRPYQCVHDVPTLGYGFFEYKQKLKSEFEGIEGKKIGELKRYGVEITECIQLPQFVYLTDTTIDVFKVNPEILEIGYKMIMIECTFLQPDDMNGEKMHIIWDQLKPIVIEHPEIDFVLIHFSAKYTKEYIKEFFEKEGLTNVFPYFLL
tara:strand:+ start:1869 stop:2687 length:819 start_codon:yes stop_codon:yes gene_type:complete